jgi:hypothetical protein
MASFTKDEEAAAYRAAEAAIAEARAARATSLNLSANSDALAGPVTPMPPSPACRPKSPP